MCSFIGESVKRSIYSSTVYVYDEKIGWIDIKVYLKELKKDVKRFEQELGNTPKKVRVCLNQEVG